MSVHAYPKTVVAYLDALDHLADVVRRHLAGELDIHKDDVYSDLKCQIHPIIAELRRVHARPFTMNDIGNG
jgi:hypothetical protein